MRELDHKTVVLMMCVVASLCGTARAAVESAPTSTPNYVGGVIQEVGITPKFGHTVPLDASFLTADGKTVRLGDCFAGKPVILHLVYYGCPMLCKLSADGLFSTLGTLSLKPGDDFTIVTISFDSREGPKLSAEARDMAIARCGTEAVAKGWHFLTGSEESVKAVTQAVGFSYVYDERTRQYAHPSGIFVLTPGGSMSRYLSGIHFAPRDVRLSLVEASDGKIGTAADQVMMLCYMYDPTVGKYGLAIMTVMRAAGVITVVTLAAAIVVMIRRERRRMLGVEFRHSERSEESRLATGQDSSLRSD